jgi:hypothetical protein
MTAMIPGQAPIQAKAGGLFEASRHVRRELEAQDLLLWCAAARRDVWAPGMQRDMAGV